MMEETENKNERKQISEHLTVDEQGNWALDISDIEGHEDLSNCPEVFERMGTELMPYLMDDLHQKLEREKRIGRDKVEKLTHQIGSVILLDEYEKARAEGMRAKFEVYMKYLQQRGGEIKSLREELIDGMREMRESFEDARAFEKVGMILSFPVWLPLSISLGVGITAVEAGVRSVKFVAKLLEAQRIRENEKGKEWEEEFEHLVTARDTDGEPIYADPYRESRGSLGVLDFAEKDIDLEGGRQR